MFKVITLDAGAFIIIRLLCLALDLLSGSTIQLEFQFLLDHSSCQMAAFIGPYRVCGVVTESIHDGGLSIQMDRSKFPQDVGPKYTAVHPQPLMTLCIANRQQIL